MRSILHSLAVASVFAAVFAAAAVPASALEIGEEPPSIDVSEWLQGEAVDLEACKGKNVVVVDIWASYEDRCKKSIPRLSKLAEKHKASGLLVVGVSDEKPDEIRTFMKDGKFKYAVACDGESNTKGPYTKGSKIKVPYSVVIDKSGVVVWQGDPLSGVERIVEGVLAGTFDTAKSKEISELQTKVEDDIAFKNWADMSADADKLLEADPAHEVGLRAKFGGFLEKKNGAGLKAWVDAMLPKIEDPQALNYIAWKLATFEDLSLRHPAAALKAARRAAEMSLEKDELILDTLARVQFESGLLDQAVESQKKAAAIPGAAEVIKTALEYYLACVEARKLAPK